MSSLLFTPESQHIDRDMGGYAYASPGQANVAMALKWMLCFEEPETRTLWLAKATPRDWLVAGEAPITASNLTTRYGRVSFQMTAAAAGTDNAGTAAGAYTVKASVTLPARFAQSGSGSQPAGGLRLRIRAPTAQAGKLSAVTIGGKPWPKSGFSAAEETVDIASEQLTAAMISDLKSGIVATFGAAEGAELRRAAVDPRRRVVPAAALAPAPAPALASASASASAAADVVSESAPAAAPSCAAAMTKVDSFADANGTAWAVCEDLQQPGGAIALLSSAGDAEWFEKTHSPYLSNTTDSSYYLGLDRTTVANASADILGAKLLQENQKHGLSWAAVEQAVPPIRRSGKAATGISWISDCAGIRTFVGSRGAAYDGTFTDQGQDMWHGDWDGCETVMQPDAVSKYNDAVGAPPQVKNI